MIHRFPLPAHNLYGMKTADGVVELGPEGGGDGRRVLAVGRPGKEVGGRGRRRGGMYLEVCDLELDKIDPRATLKSCCTRC